MNDIEFSNTKLKVSPICLGTVNYGTALPAGEARRQISQFVDAGGNFIDTAHVYGDWEPEILGRSERVIGEWIKETGMRNKIVLATKGAHPPLDRMGHSRVSPAELEKDLAESLLYLNTDYIDIYFLHRDDPSVPVSEILDFLDEKEREGKIRYYGCSNWSLERIKEAAEYARKKNRPGFICNQLMWSLAEINYDHFEDKTMVPMDLETYEYHSRTKMNVMAYTSIARGYFTRRSLGQKISPSMEKVYKNPVNDALYDMLLKFSKETDLTIMDLSLIYLSSHDFPSLPIVSFSTDQQLKDGMRCCELTVDKNRMKELHRLKKHIL